VALEDLKAVRTTPLAHECQKEVNYICTRYSVGLIGTPNLLEYEVIKSLGARKGRLYSEFSWTRASNGSPYMRHTIQDWSLGLLPSIEKNGKVLLTPNNRLQNKSRDLLWVLRLNSRLLIGLNPRL